jgi:acetyl-CoA decarbonylase/synthase complex subunit delta
MKETMNDEVLKLGIQSWPGRVYELEIGADSQRGGTRDKVIKVGGQNCMPFLHFEGEMPNPPQLAIEILDIKPQEYPQELVKAFGSALNDPLDWAKKCVQDYGFDLLCLRFVGAHPDWGNRSSKECAQIVEKILQAVKTPLIIIGCGEPEKDQDLLFEVSTAAQGENCLIGMALDNNYKSVVASCISNGHSLIAETPIDINLCKQLNILISDMGFPVERIVIHHATASLGYGLEYTYSIMERTRLAALQGDKLLSQPMISFVGWEVWKTKEARASDQEMPEWGELSKRGVFWEVVTSIAYLQAGADVLVLNHPSSIIRLKDIIEDLMSKQEIVP